MDTFEVSIGMLFFLFTVASVAGFVDTLAGGGGLISLPALIISGVPPLSALGTNKLQGSMGTATATFMMFKKKQISWLEVRGLMLSAFVGSALGTVLVQFINTNILSSLIPVILFIIGIYFLLSPAIGETERISKMSLSRYRYSVIPFVGCYDGMFGPGTGSFFTLAGVICRGQGLIRATATAKSLNFSTNIASLFIFVMVGHIVWLAGLVMMVGQVFGAYLGSHCLFKIKPKMLKTIIVIMCFGMLIRYFFE